MAKRVGHPFESRNAMTKLSRKSVDSLLDYSRLTECEQHWEKENSSRVFTSSQQI